MKAIELTQGRVALVDDEDYPLVAYRPWVAMNAGAQTRPFRGPKGMRILMHRLIMNPPAGYVVDHINGDKLDNRRTNLRICTQLENTRNRKPRQTREYIGIAEYGSDWLAIFRGKPIGRFMTDSLAAQAYDAAAREAYGEFARVNFPNEEERLQRATIDRASLPIEPRRADGPVPQTTRQHWQRFLASEMAVTA